VGGVACQVLGDFERCSVVLHGVLECAAVWFSRKSVREDGCVCVLFSLGGDTRVGLGALVGFCAGWS